jgi:hypothetical protein
MRKLLAHTSTTAAHSTRGAATHFFGCSRCGCRTTLCSLGLSLLL